MEKSRELGLSVIWVEPHPWEVGYQSLPHPLSSLLWRGSQGQSRTSVWEGLGALGQRCSRLARSLGLWSTIFSVNLLDVWNFARSSEEFFHRWTREKVQDIGGWHTSFRSQMGGG